MYSCIVYSNKQNMRKVFTDRHQGMTINKLKRRMEYMNKEEKLDFKNKLRERINK
jgi:hypothetical protein